MPDDRRPTPYTLPAEDRERLTRDLAALVRRTGHALAPQTTPADAGAALTATPAQVRAQDLAQLRATELLRAALEEHAHMLALDLGRRTDAPVTYTDLGDAVGITRQAARTRWPGAIPDARPGRPRTSAPDPAHQDREPGADAPADAPAPDEVRIARLTAAEAATVWPGGERVYAVRAGDRLLGWVWRTAEGKEWGAGLATPDGTLAEILTVMERSGRRTRAQAVGLLRERVDHPGPHPRWTPMPDRADTPQEDPAPEAVVDMGERIGPGWVLRREGPADAHTWILLHQGRVRGRVRRYRPRHGGLSKGWEALAGEGGPRGVIRRSATEAGKFGRNSSFLWRSRDLAAWGIATNPEFGQPNPAWAHRRPPTP